MVGYLEFNGTGYSLVQLPAKGTEKIDIDTDMKAIKY